MPTSGPGGPVGSAARPAWSLVGAHPYGARGKLATAQPQGSAPSLPAWFQFCSRQALLCVLFRQVVVVIGTGPKAFCPGDDVALGKNSLLVECALTHFMQQLHMGFAT